MSLKQEVHELVDGLHEDSQFLAELRNSLREDRLIAEALNASDRGEVYSYDEFMAMVEARWPREVSE